jgi:NitT/TauT family transport system substrate-binding protein
MNIDRRKLLIGFILVDAVVVSLILLYVLNRPNAGVANTASGERVRIQLNWVPEPEFGGFYAALQDGLYAQEGIDVEIIKGAAGTPAPQMASSGQVECAIASADQMLTLNEKGGDLTAVFSVFETSPMGIMVKADAPWTSLEELWKSDATVAVEAGLPYLKYLSKKIPDSKVRIVPTGAGLAGFERGAVQGQQCFVTAEPVQMELKKVPVRVFSLAASGYDPYAVLVVTKASWLAEHREVAAKLVRALREGWTRYLADPAKYNVAIAKLNPAMSVEAMNIAAEKQRDLVAPPGTGAHEIGSMSSERWTTLATQLQELGTISKQPASIDAVFWNAPK